MAVSKEWKAGVELAKKLKLESKAAKVAASVLAGAVGLIVTYGITAVLKPEWRRKVDEWVTKVTEWIANKVGSAVKHLPEIMQNGLNYVWKVIAGAWSYTIGAIITKIQEYSEKRLNEAAPVRPAKQPQPNTDKLSTSELIGIVTKQEVEKIAADIMGGLKVDAEKGKATLATPENKEDKKSLLKKVKEKLKDKKFLAFAATAGIVSGFIAGILYIAKKNGVSVKEAAKILLAKIWAVLTSKTFLGFGLAALAALSIFAYVKDLGGFKGKVQEIWGKFKDFFKKQENEKKKE